MRYVMTRPPISRFCRQRDVAVLALRLETGDDSGVVGWAVIVAKQPSEQREVLYRLFSPTCDVSSGFKQYRSPLVLCLSVCNAIMKQDTDTEPYDKDWLWYTTYRHKLESEWSMMYSLTVANNFLAQIFPRLFWSAFYWQHRSIRKTSLWRPTGRMVLNQNRWLYK